MAAKQPFICNGANCGIQVKWPEPYVQGQKPINMDGTIHNHGQASSGQMPQQAAPQQAAPAPSPQPMTPPKTIDDIIKEYAAIIQGCDLEKMSDAKFESMMKFYISRMMSQR